MGKITYILIMNQIIFMYYSPLNMDGKNQKLNIGIKMMDTQSIPWIIPMEKN